MFAMSNKTIGLLFHYKHRVVGTIYFSHRRIQIEGTETIAETNNDLFLQIAESNIRKFAIRD